MWFGESTKKCLEITPTVLLKVIFYRFWVWKGIKHQFEKIKNTSFIDKSSDFVNVKNENF